MSGISARGDARTESDADIGAVLKDGDRGYGCEQTNLAHLGYIAPMDHGQRVGPWPVSEID